MTDDIVEWLRDRAFKRCGPTMEAVHTKMKEWQAADEIEKLRAEQSRLQSAVLALTGEIEKLRAALKRLHDAATDIGDDEMSYSIREWWNNETDAAKTALGESDE